MTRNAGNRARTALAKGSTVEAVVKKLGITEQTYYRWSKEYGGLSCPPSMILRRAEDQP